MLTLWDWTRPKAYLHDLIGTDRRNPTVNANGKLYGATENSTDWIPILDPVRHTATEVQHPVRDPKTPSHRTDPLAASPYWGDEPIWDSQTSTHNPMMDEQGRTWFTARIRPADNPDFCKKGSNHPSAKVFPLERATRHLSMYDPKSGKFTLISTCFQTHHLIFAEDADHTLVDEQRRRRRRRRRLAEPPDVRADRRRGALAGLDAVHRGHERQRQARRVGRAEPAGRPGEGQARRRQLLRGRREPEGRLGLGHLARAFPELRRARRARAGPHATRRSRRSTSRRSRATARAAATSTATACTGCRCRAATSASFDRRKCKGPLNGPAAATGKHCPEGWTLYPLPGPQFRDVTETGSVESSYYTWVDQFDTSGLGRNVPIATGNLNDSLLALVNGKFVNLRVPYPMGFFTKWVEGRIDDPNAGWKGRGLWATYSTRAVFHSEGGTENRPQGREVPGKTGSARALARASGVRGRPGPALCTGVFPVPRSAGTSPAARRGSR